MIHRPWRRIWLQGTAFVALVSGLRLALVSLPTDPTVDAAELLPTWGAVDPWPVLFALVVIIWAGMTFTESYQGRFWPVVSAGLACALGVWAVSLAGPLWLELTTVAACVFITLSASRSS